MFKNNKVILIVYVILSAFAFYACSASTPKSFDGSMEPVTIAYFEVKHIGPGGHSNGAYGNVNALHASARALIKLEELCDADGITFYVKELSGGNSVNSIAADGYYIVGLVKGDKAVFKTHLDNSANFGMIAENNFRSITTGQTNPANGTRLDIRVDFVRELPSS